MEIFNLKGKIQILRKNSNSNIRLQQSSKIRLKNDLENKYNKNEPRGLTAWGFDLMGRNKKR